MLSTTSIVLDPLSLWCLEAACSSHRGNFSRSKPPSISTFLFLHQVEKSSKALTDIVTAIFLIARAIMGICACIGSFSHKHVRRYFLTRLSWDGLLLFTNILKVIFTQCMRHININVMIQNMFDCYNKNAVCFVFCFGSQNLTSKIKRAALLSETILRVVTLLSMEIGNVAAAPI